MGLMSQEQIMDAIRNNHKVMGVESHEVISAYHALWQEAEARADKLDELLTKAEEDRDMILEEAGWGA